VNKSLKKIAGQNEPALRRTTMRRKVLACVFLISIAIGTPTAMANSVSGAVTDAQNTVNFQGANVRIEGLDRSVTTDSRGRFRLSNVPVGSHTLVVSYVGAGDTRFEIDVPEGGLDMGDVAIGGELVEEIITYGQAAAVASGLSQERSAINTVSALDTDAMGQFPDQNVAESLRRLPGVSVENDQGEGRYVVIRGMDPDLNSTSINGIRATAAEPRRALQLDVIPSDVLDGLEIAKTLTPDMDGDAIGGSINIKTLSAFSRKGAYVKARAETSYNELREEWSPKLSFAGSNIFDLSNGNRLGVAGAISWNDRQLHADNNEADDWEEAGNGADFIEEFQPRLYTIDRERIGGTLNFDLDVSDSTTLHLYTLYSKFTDTELRNRLTFKLDSLNEVTVTNEFAEYDEAELERDTKDRDQTAENLSISFGSETQLTDWLIETKFGYNYAKEETPDQVEAVWVAEFITGDNIPAGSPVLSLNHSNHQIPVMESAFESTLYDDTLYELDEIETQSEKNEDTQYSLRFDMGRDTGFGSMKFGVKARFREKKTDEEIGIWEGDGTKFLSDVPNPGGGDAYGFPQEMNPVPDTQGIRSILAAEDGIDFNDFKSETDSNVADFIYDEDVLAIYGMGTWENGPMVITAGIRVEWTDLDSRGNIVNPVEEGDDGPDGNPVTEDTVFITAVQETNSYSDVLPSINLRYEFSEKLVGRASAHRSVVRPRVEDIAFRAEIDGNDIELGNPLLDPFRAWNADASLAYYPTDLSVLSAGIFWKKIEDFIFIQAIDDYDFLGRTFDEATIALNGDDADVFGIELNYQQHFGFLGAPWDAFLIALNYTYVDTEATVDDRKIALPKQSRSVASFMLGYDKHGLDLRLAMSYRDRYIDELEGEGEDRYTDDHMQWDFTAKYHFNESWQIYAEITNLGNEPEYYYSGRNTRLLQYDEYGTTSALGVQYNFQ